jgi:hypothetical protein
LRDLLGKVCNKLDWIHTMTIIHAEACGNKKICLLYSTFECDKSASNIRVMLLDTVILVTPHDKPTLGVTDCCQWRALASSMMCIGGRCQFCKHFCTVVLLLLHYIPCLTDHKLSWSKEHTFQVVGENCAVLSSLSWQRGAFSRLYYYTYWWIQSLYSLFKCSGNALCFQIHQQVVLSNRTKTIRLKKKSLRMLEPRCMLGFAEWMPRPFLGAHAWRSCHACPNCKSKSSNVMPPLALSTASHFIPATLFVMFMGFLSAHSFCRMTNVSKARALSILAFWILEPLFQHFIWHKLSGANHFAVISRI